MALLALFETPELQGFKMVKIRFVCGYGTVGQRLYETHRPTTEKNLYFGHLAKLMRGCWWVWHGGHSGCLKHLTYKVTRQSKSIRVVSDDV